ncbi:MAG: divalent cation transporter [Gammaproteobacteria bacterium]
MSDCFEVILLTFLAGAAMPLGAIIAKVERIRRRWLERELRHGVIAFGGGALLAAVALVLIPEGIQGMPMFLIVLCFGAGAVLFMLLDIWLTKSGTPMSQLIAMLSDFIPESMALGAFFVVSRPSSLLLAAIIGLQNIPEGFNAYRELRASTHMPCGKIIAVFSALAMLGPLCGVLGFYFLSQSTILVSGIMLFAAGGILYLIFQDIAPQAKLENHWAPPLGAVAGFLFGVVGKVLIDGL